MGSDLDPDQGLDQVLARTWLRVDQTLARLREYARSDVRQHRIVLSVGSLRPTNLSRMKTSSPLTQRWLINRSRPIA